MMQDLHDPQNVRTSPPELPPPLPPPPPSAGERACEITGALSCLAAFLGMITAAALFGLLGLILGVVSLGLPGRKLLGSLGLAASGLVFLSSPVVTHSYPRPVYSNCR
jgi:hypothetical protein